MSGKEKEEQPEALEAGENDRGELEFELPDPEEPEEDTPEEPRRTRAEKKRDRFREVQSERDDLRRRLEALESRTGPPARSNPAPDPELTRIKELESRRRDLAARAQAEIDAKTITAEAYQRYQEQAEELDEQKAELRAQRAARSMVAGIQEKVRTETLRSEFADINADPVASTWAKAHWQQLVAEEVSRGVSYDAASNSRDLLNRAASAARNRFGIGPRREPTDADRSRLSAAGKSQAGAAPKGNRVGMTRTQAQMAHAMYPDLPEKEAEKRWAARVGRKVKELRR